MKTCNQLQLLYTYYFLLQSSVKENIRGSAVCVAHAVVWSAVITGQVQFRAIGADQLYETAQLLMVRWLGAAGQSRNKEVGNGIESIGIALFPSLLVDEINLKIFNLLRI